MYIIIHQGIALEDTFLHTRGNLQLGKLHLGRLAENKRTVMLHAQLKFKPELVGALLAFSKGTLASTPVHFSKSAGVLS